MTDGAPGPPRQTAPRPGARRWFLWIALPAVLGVLVGTAAAATPWGRDLLGIAPAVSGLAWVLRVASDWVAEHAGPQRGVVLLGSTLLGLWLVLAVSSPGPLRSLGFGPIRLQSPDRDPYAVPPAGSVSPLQSLQQPPEPLDLKGLVMPGPREPEEEAPDTTAPPVNGQRVATSAELTLSSATSVAGEGVVLIAKVHGDGRPVRGVVDFMVDATVVARQSLRVQGDSSQIEYRLVGLKPGLHMLRAAYRGSRSFDPSVSEPVPHRVAGR